MKRVILLLSIILTFTLAGDCQVTPLKYLRVDYRVTVFGHNLPIGSMIYCQSDSTFWVAKLPTLGTKSITTALTGVATIMQLNSSGLVEETDPIVRAIEGIVKADGDTITAAIPVTDYLLPYTLFSKPAWETSTVYNVGDIVTVAGEGDQLGSNFWFMCRLAHTSSGGYLIENITDLGYWNCIEYQAVGGSGATYTMSAMLSPTGAWLKINGSDGSKDSILLKESGSIRINRNAGDTITFYSYGVQPDTISDTSTNTSDSLKHTHLFRPINLKLYHGGGEISTDDPADSILIKTADRIPEGPAESSPIRITTGAAPGISGNIYLYSGLAGVKGKGYLGFSSESPDDYVNDFFAKTQLVTDSTRKLATTEYVKMVLADLPPAEGGGATYSMMAHTGTGGAYLKILGSDGSMDSVKLAAGTNITSIVRTNDSVITINAANQGAVGLVDDLNFEFGDILYGVSQTYTLDIKASYGYTINSASLETDAGTLTGIAVKINTTAVTSLSSVTADATVDETNSSGANTVVAGDRVYIITSTGYTGAPTVLRGKLKITRT